MDRIAYLACAVTLPGAPNRRSDAFEHDQDYDAIAEPLRLAGYALEAVSWDNTTVDWSVYKAAIIRTTWDYWDRRDEFLSQLDAISDKTRVFNPPSLVRWNIRKTYLRELESTGVRIIPTLWIDHPDADAVADAFDALNADDVVFKRQIGAGAEGQVRLRRGEATPTFVHPMMAQAFVPSIQTEGEYSFVFVDGEFSHALVKRARAGDYRIQTAYGGVEDAVTPSEHDLSLARGVLAALDAPPLYARIDMVRASDGELMLMELEIIEPFLYPLQGPNFGALMADAIVRRLR
ncbi:MAG: hypothetical protein AAFQ67_02315 [Pseudomonadota bacterium]